MAVSLLARLAAQAPAPVHLLLGEGGRDHARALRIDPRLRLVDSPRHATVLAVVGRLPEAQCDAARGVHDQLSSPRGVVVLEEGPAGSASPFDEAEVVRDPAALGQAIVAMHRALITGERASASPLGPRDNPVQWRGVGPHGQGGKGMMGGKPYGRGMAMTGPDVRDGLALDRLSIPLGPFVAWLPPGISFDLVMQGDVVQEARLHAASFERADEPEVFRRARDEEVPLAELERARARHHLFATADLLALHGLEAWAVRVTRLARDLGPEVEDAVRRLDARLRRTGALSLGTRGVGVVEGEPLSGMGPVARAAGLAEDARAEDPAYEELGFEPVVQGEGDAQARWRQRLAEAAQALALARRAGERTRSPEAPLEGVRGTLRGKDAQRWRERLEAVAVGQAFDAFATTVVSLDLDAALLPPRPDGEDA